jgi:hypothetical protein
MSILDIGHPPISSRTQPTPCDSGYNDIPITARLSATLQMAGQMAQSEREHQDEVRAETLRVLEQQRSGEAIRNALEHTKHTEHLKTFPFHSTIAQDSVVGSIRLGAHKRHIGQYCPFKEDMTYHRDQKQPLSLGDTSHVEYKPTFECGLSTTKFGGGFMRRQGSSVFNPLKDAEAQKFEESQHRKEKLREKRKQDLDGIRFGNGFNLISNEVKNPELYKRSAAKPQGKKKLRQLTSHESIINGMNALKDSLGRFHMPHGSGDFFDSRQEQLYREGTYEKKMTRVLGKLIPSTGVEDQFSKSEYDKNLTVSGLCTSRKPGDYTPRKQIGNPSANDKLRKLWTNKIKFDSRPEDTSIVDNV